MKTALINRRQLLNRIKAELKGSTENMEFQRDNTQNYANTKLWEGAMFAEEMIIDIIKKF